MSVVHVKPLVFKKGVRRRRGSLGKNWRVFLLVVGRVRIEVAARRGFGYTAWAFDSPRRGTVSVWGVDTYQEMIGMKKKKKPDAAATARHLAPMESNILHAMMPLVEHCAATQYEDGDPRKPGWFTVRTFGSTWQIEVKDPDTMQMMRITQPTLDDALMMASLLLAAEDAPWEPDTWAMTQAKKSKK